jgi:hypothetical protein
MSFSPDLRDSIRFRENPETTVFFASNSEHWMQWV